MTPHVLVGIARDSSPNVLVYAAAEAALRETGLHVVHVWNTGLGVAGATDTTALSGSAARRFTSEAVAELETLVPVTDEAVGGDAGRVLVALSATACLLVVGTSRQRGEGGMLLGQVAQHCVRHAACPVIVVPHDWIVSPARSGLIAVDR
jgi:nucleotide-binding universal stress UspA family protein